jgi:hypothetical protein
MRNPNVTTTGSAFSIILLYSWLKYLIRGIWVHALFEWITLNGKMVTGMKDRFKLSSEESHYSELIN